MSDESREQLLWLREDHTVHDALTIVRLLKEENRPTGGGANYERWYLVVVRPLTKEEIADRHPVPPYRGPYGIFDPNDYRPPVIWGQTFPAPSFPGGSITVTLEKGQNEESYSTPCVGSGTCACSRSGGEASICGCNRS